MPKDYLLLEQAVLGTDYVYALDPSLQKISRTHSFTGDLTLDSVFTRVGRLEAITSTCFKAGDTTSETHIPLVLKGSFDIVSFNSPKGYFKSGVPKNTIFRGPSAQEQALVKALDILRGQDVTLDQERVLSRVFDCELLSGTLYLTGSPKPELYFISERDTVSLEGNHLIINGKPSSSFPLPCRKAGSATLHRNVFRLHSPEDTYQAPCLFYTPRIILLDQKRLVQIFDTFIEDRISD